VPVSTLRNWENDRGFPGLPVLVRLAEVLGVPVERFAEGVDEPEVAAGASRRMRKGKTP
jgi:transcriptional regulator with XRE-family HTH domain